MNKLIDIEIVYALPDRQELLSLPVPEGSSIEACINISGIAKHFSEIVPNKAQVGIFSVAQKLSTIVKAGDRIEIYRPLIADPKEMRKIRAAKLAKNKA
jgi:putative ubiquitin-RnfH superfamily antitoxin RatB of RatAB toxin-antitoxin module